MNRISVEGSSPHFIGSWNIGQNLLCDEIVNFFESHLLFPLTFLAKQIGILIPFFIMCFFAISKFKIKINFKDQKLLFLLIINFVPILLMFLTSMIMGVKIRTMWMTPFYLFFGVLVIYIFQSQINLNKLKGFATVFIILFIFSPFAYAYVSITETDKRTDYQGKEIAKEVQEWWDNQTESKMYWIFGNEWKAGNLSYNLKSRPRWFGTNYGYLGPLDNNYGYNDIFYTQTSTDYNTGEETTTQDWCWVDEDGNQVAHSDLDFRETVMPGLMNRFNGEAWDLLDPWVEVAPIIGMDFYHYDRNFWLHAYANYILPAHKYIAGEEEFSYLNRNNWGVDGGPTIGGDEEYEQWEDYQGGLVFGWKLSKSIGVFFEGEYTKFWDSEIYNSSVGLNITLK